MIEQENLRQLPLRELNQRLGSLDDFYKRLSLKGYFLPDLKKGCTTAEYLYGVMSGKYFSIMRKDIRLGFPLVKASKIDLYGYLQSETRKELGFKLTQLPGREWLEACLFSLKPEHRIFKKPEMLIEERVFDVPEW